MYRHTHTSMRYTHAHTCTCAFITNCTHCPIVNTLFSVLVERLGEHCITSGTRLHLSLENRFAVTAPLQTLPYLSWDLNTTAMKW